MTDVNRGRWTDLRRSLFLQCAAVFVVAATMRISLGIVLGAFHREPDGEIFFVAQSIATHGVFGLTPTTPTTYVAPIYPYLLAALLKLTPNNMVFALVVATLNILVASLVWGLLPAVAEVFALPRRAGIVAGVVGAVSPLRHWTELNGYWDTALGALATMVLVAFTFSRRFSWTKTTRAMGIGVGWGLAALLQPATATVFAVLLGLLAFMPGSRAAKFRGTALALAAFALTLMPWTIRNYRTFGGIAFVRGNLGEELSGSNNDGALPDSVDNLLHNPQVRYPYTNRAELARHDEMGELPYDRSRLKEALAWMAAHPAQLARLTLQRFRLFWLPERSVMVFSLMEWALTSLAFIGLLSLPRSHRDVRSLILGIWVVYPLLYYFINADGRYRYPIEWTIVLAAGIGVSRVLGLRSFSPEEHRWLTGEQSRPTVRERA
jgi:hypothetical protein